MSLEKVVGHLINRKKNELEKGCWLFVLHEPLNYVMLDLHNALWGKASSCVHGKYHEKMPWNGIIWRGGLYRTTVVLMWSFK